MSSPITLTTFALWIGAAPLTIAQTGGRVYLDPGQPIEARIADLISQMTLEEKAAQLNHLSSRNDRLHIPAWGGWNQTLHGVWSKQQHGHCLQAYSTSTIHCLPLSAQTEVSHVDQKVWKS
jgi:hypothetical protein